MSTKILWLLVSFVKISTMKKMLLMDINYLITYLSTYLLTYSLAPWPTKSLSLHNYRCPFFSVHCFVWLSFNLHLPKIPFNILQPSQFWTLPSSSSFQLTLKYFLNYLSTSICKLILHLSFCSHVEHVACMKFLHVLLSSFSQPPAVPFLLSFSRLFLI
jgi:hypothetical protein